MVYRSCGLQQHSLQNTIRRMVCGVRSLMAATCGGLALLFCTSASAAIDCQGTVDNLSLDLSTSGVVTVSLSGGPSWVYLCTIDAANNGVSPTVCRTMYSTLALAKATGKKVLIRFYDHQSCTAIPSWAWAGQLGWTRVLID
jgi:hypothetical protein